MNDTISVKVIKIGMIGLTALGIIAIMIMAYVFAFFTRDLRGVNIIGDTNYIREATNEERESRPFIEVNIFTNQNRNGYFFSEIKFNHFLGLRVDNPDHKMSYGLQWLHRTEPRFMFDTNRWRASRTNFIVGRTSWSPSENTINQRASQHGLRGVMTSYQSQVVNDFHFRRDVVMTIPIDGRPYQVSVLNHWNTGESASLLTNPLINIRVGSNRRHYNNWDRIFNHVVFNSLNNIVTLDGTYQRQGTFDVILPLFDLLQINEIRGGTVQREPVDRVDTYAMVRISINHNGFRNARQSLFNMIGGRGDFDLNDSEYNSNFATYRQHVRLTEQSFDKRFSQLHNGYVISLSNRARTQLFDMRRFYLIVDIQAGFNNIRGIDFNGLRYLNIHMLRIRGSGDFNILQFAFYNTIVSNIQIGGTVNLIDNHNQLQGVAHVS
ncbi:MAG: hypothetical protein FWE01_01075 [Firmicutes bacterium]|nr:hypothetical protein [Bacillota bacterium]